MPVIDLTQLMAPHSTAPNHGQQRMVREMYFRPKVKHSADLERVLALPRRALEIDGTDRANAIIQMMTARYSRGPVQCRCAQIDPERHSKEGCISTFRLLQALALRELGIVGGLLGPIGVGHGKTMMDLLAPFAFSMHAQANGQPFGENILCVLLVPPKLVPQLAGDYDYIGQHFHMPSMVVQGAPEYDRIQFGVPKLQVMPYSRISRPESTAWLNIVKPHAIIADECHKLRNLKTATGARVKRFMEEHEATRFAAWSGSMTSKSIKDYDRLSDWCLRNGSPLPRDPEVTDDWARTIDPSKNPADPGALLDGLIDNGFCLPGETLYKGVHRRLTETIGVVTSSQPSIDCELEIIERKAPKIPTQIDQYIEQALAFVRPDGEELVTALQAVDCACTLACGFHYKWIYPHNKFPDDEKLVYDWFELRKLWHKEQRSMLHDPQEHMDSPMLLEHAAQRALGLRPANKELPSWSSKHYLAWYNIRDKVRPESKAVRVDPYLVIDALDWGMKHKGVIWYQHTAFGEWLHEMSQGALPLFGGGDEAKVKLLGDSSKGIRGEDGSRSVILSIKTHGTGTNGLQWRFNEQLYGSNPAASDQWEQTLGRLHRPGQTAKKVTAEIYTHTRELKKHVLAALHSALYVEGTWGTTQKLRVAAPLAWHDEIDDED